MSEGSDVCSQDDVLAYYDGSAAVCKSDLMTLVNKSEISAAVIDCYCYLLNDKASKAREDKFYFGTQHMLSLNKLYDLRENKDSEEYRSFCKNLHDSWSYWVSKQKNPMKELHKYDLFFSPIIYGSHYSVFVYDRRFRQMTLIDNRKDSIMAIYEDFFKIIRDEFEAWLNENGKIFNVVRQFKFHNLQFSWKNNASDNDCGVYLMKHMEFFDDSLSCNSLRMASYRTVCRAQICLDIVLSEYNCYLKFVSENFSSFIALKADAVKVPSLKKK